VRVLLMADSFRATGGGEVMVAYLARRLQQQGHDVAVLTAGRGKTGRFSDEGILLYQLRSDYHPRLRPALSILNPAVVRGVSAAIRDFKPDVVHAWNVHHHLSYESLRIAARHAPVVHTSQDALAFCYTKFHCWIDPTKVGQALPEPRAHPERCRNCRALFWSFPVRNRLARGYLNQCVRVPVAVSHALADGLVANGLPRPRVVHNGIPQDDFDSKTEDHGEIYDRWKLGAGPCVLAGGRLSHFKGHELAVHAFQPVAAAHATAQLLIMGSYGWYGDKLAGIAAQLGIADRVKFLGLVPRDIVPIVLHRSAAVLTLSMYLDPFPTMNLEAMAASRGVVGTCFGGTPEAVMDGETGYIVNPYDGACVSERIRELVTDADRAASLGKSGRKRLLDCFTAKRMADDYERVYTEARGTTQLV
jgi:glycosyltransferase involved in cell wall biosynthesis